MIRYSIGHKKIVYLPIPAALCQAHWSNCIYSDYEYFLSTLVEYTRGKRQKYQNYRMCLIKIMKHRLHQHKIPYTLHRQATNISIFIDRLHYYGYNLNLRTKQHFYSPVPSPRLPIHFCPEVF